MLIRLNVKTLYVGNVKLSVYRYISLCSLVPVLLISLLLRSRIYLRLPGVIHEIILGVHSYYVMLRASGKTASATLVHQNQLFIIIKVIILLDYVYIVHLMYSCLHICISIDFGNKYLSKISIYLSTREIYIYIMHDGDPYENVMEVWNEIMNGTCSALQEPS